MRQLRSSLVLLLCTTVSAPLYAQRGCGLDADPSKRVEGSGVLPSGWTVRFDPTPSNCTPLKSGDVSFVTMGTGLHVTSGPAGIYFNPNHGASGDFTVSASFAQRASSGHEAYGLFIGGVNLQDSTQRYLYFLIRPSDGGVYIQQRLGNAPPARGGGIVPWLSETPGVIKDGPNGAATNVLAIRVQRDSVHFLANDLQVRAIPKSRLGGMSTDGQTGLRINHNLNLHIEGFGVKK